MLGVNGKYLNVHDDALVAAFHRYVDTDIPLFAIKEDILYLMDIRKNNFFEIPAKFTRNNKKAVFEFEVVTHNKNKTFEVYTFREVKFYDEHGNEVLNRKS